MPTQIPCTHVIASCANDKDCANTNTYTMCAKCYTVESYSKSYAGLFYLVHNLRYWTEYNGLAVLPPEVRRPPDHPPSVRICGTIDEGHEGHMCYRCKICKQLGLNKRRCPNAHAPSSFTG